MKSALKSAPYFSAYPLKVITEHTATEPNLEPYLTALLASKTKNAGRTRVFPMVNPYPAAENLYVTPQHHSKTQVTVEPTGKEWFAHYE